MVSGSDTGVFGPDKSDGSRRESRLGEKGAPRLVTHRLIAHRAIGPVTFRWQTADRHRIKKVFRRDAFKPSGVATCRNGPPVFGRDRQDFPKTARHRHPTIPRMGGVPDGLMGGLTARSTGGKIVPSFGSTMAGHRGVWPLDGGEWHRVCVGSASLGDRP